ncbi:hypothetical protein [Conexibacter sp. CPCC 206217]|uniref:hypothetical protein n=1 Tax=Conexibacter sp. CPCC 206217 TaxID=3064574 RepID=UPI0027235201|nr:hypothetical protein [Conexibacter sp. CPCC 206217]MDO8209324.1 hypothetical protein [Conexibacter sp. CPCC 206217]
MSMPALARVLAVAATALPLAGTLAPASTAAQAEWQFAPALAPAPPIGALPSPYRVRLGNIGDIEFWSPNRGVLITSGTEASGGIVPMGVYAYDGVDWHQLSTVCGGADGRIAFSGPDEFWTIADQRPGQVTQIGASLANMSLCHFQGGRVVGSYAMPLDQPNSYRPMNAVACRSADDCWFAGARAVRPGRGGFHLHWDGSAVTAFYSPQDHAITDIAALPGQLYESVRLGEDDVFADEDPATPALLHTIASPSSSTIFRSVVPSDSACAGEVVCPPLPDYGRDPAGRPVWPATLGGFSLSSDWSLAGSSTSPPQLWAIAGLPFGTPKVPAGRGAGHPIALRFSGGTWTQVVPRLGTFPDGQTPLKIAAEPGTGAAWVALGTDGAHTSYVARVSADGSVTAVGELGVDQGVGKRGTPSAISCPAANDCWLGTDEGWLFHLTNGAQLPRDTDPSFAGVITFRPPDGGVPFAPPDDPPPDDSLRNQAPPLPPVGPGNGDDGDDRPRRQRRTRVVRLVKNARREIVRRTTLKMTFTLTARAHVQLVASRRSRVVARSPKRTMNAGRRVIMLRLYPRRWPTKLDLRATPAPASKRKHPKKPG